jgi:hypothetical protein
MKSRRLAIIASASIACAACAPMHAVDRAGPTAYLECPTDRSPRMADIEAAESSVGVQQSPEARRHSLERVKSICAAGLRYATVVTADDHTVAAVR